MTTRLHGEERKIAILQTGLELWKTQGAAAVTARGIGQKLGLTHAGVLYHHGNSDNLKTAIAEYAVRVNDIIVVPQLITINHPAIAHLDQIRRQAFLSTAALQVPDAG